MQNVEYVKETTKHPYNAHPYAEILHAIAEGKQIQFYSSSNGWVDQSYVQTLLEIVDEAFPTNKYRIKPDVILINSIEVPKSCTVELCDKEVYYYPCIETGDKFTRVEWHSDIYDKRLLKLGLVHLTKEAAIKHAEALLSFYAAGLRSRSIT